jgi:hypothetical protein
LQYIVPMKTKKQKTKQDQAKPVSGSWEPIPEREALPNVRKGKEIVSYFLQMHKNNALNYSSRFPCFPATSNSLEYNKYCARESLKFAMFLRDFKLTNRHTFIEINNLISLNLNTWTLIQIAKHGRNGKSEQVRFPNYFIFCGVSYVLGFPSVFSFFSFLESVYSVPYNRMMKGEGVKRGQPWYCLNYEDGTMQQGRNDDEEHNNTDL